MRIGTARASALLIIALAALIAALVGCDNSGSPAGPVFAEKEAAQKRPGYPVALIPIYNPSRSSEFYAPLVEGLNKLLPEGGFTLETSRDFPDFEGKIKRGEPALIWPNHLQALIALKSGYHVIVSGTAELPLRGLLVVRKDGPIAKPADLKGKAVSFPSPTALLASVLTQHYLYRQGLDVNRDIESKYVGSMDSAIMNVYLKQTAAGGGYTLSWEAFKKDHPAEAADLKIIWESEPLAYNVVMLKNDVPKDVEEKIVAHLTGLKNTDAGRVLIRRMGVTGYSPASDMDVGQIQRLIDEYQKNVRPIEGL